MKIDKNVQYGLLLVLYLTRSGRSTLQHVAEGLKIPQPFLQQIANKLRRAGVLKSVKGPKGGYEIAFEVRVLDVFNALHPIALIAQKDMNTYVTGDVEHRVLASLASNLRFAMTSQLSVTVRSLEKECTINELAILNRLTHSSVLN